LASFCFFYLVFDDPPLISSGTSPQRENLRRDQEFKPKHAIALSNFTILGGAIANTMANLRRSAGGGPGKKPEFLRQKMVRYPQKHYNEDK
jgi:hypothetical protein